jgi:hypothetical protein
MACVTDNSPAVASPVLRLEPSYPPGDRICVPPREMGTVYHSTAARRSAERAYNRGLGMERGPVAADVA